MQAGKLIPAIPGGWREGAFLAIHGIAWFGWQGAGLLFAMMIARIEKLIRQSLQTRQARDFVYRNKVYVAARRAWRDNARRRNIPEDRIDAFLREIEHCIENIELEFQLGPPPLQSAGRKSAAPGATSAEAAKPDANRATKRTGPGPFADPQEWPEELISGQSVRVPPPSSDFWKLRMREKLVLALLAIVILSGVVAFLLR